MPILTVLNLLGLGGLGYGLYCMYKGLNDRVKNLTALTKEQKKTLEAVRERATEMDTWRRKYKELVQDFQELGGKLDARRNDLVKELEDANQKKDQQLIELREA